MLFWYFMVVVPLATYYLYPELLDRYKSNRTIGRRLLLGAALSYFISWFLPSFRIHGIDTSFTTHLVGGGFYAGFLWLYTVRHMGWKLPLLPDIAGLFAMVSSLGALNELVELFLVEVGSLRITSIDAWWDIFANTLGVAIFYILYVITTRFRVR